MASFEKRGNSWRAHVTRKGFPRMTATFDTKYEAERWAAEIEGDMSRRRFVDTRAADKLLVAEALDRYLDEITSKKKSAQSEKSVIKMLKAAFGSHTITTIRGVDIAAWRDLRLEAVKAGTVRRNLAVFSHVFTVARKDWGLHVANPCDDIRFPSPGRPRENRIPEDHHKRLCKHAKYLHPLLPPIITFGIETGMRRSEILSLSKSNIKRNIAILDDTKNGDSRRVPLSKKALQVIKSLDPKPNGKLFDLHKDTVTQYFAKAAHLAGLDGTTFHDTRHEATSRFFEKGLNVMEVAAITGHKDLQTLKRYTHLSPSELAKKLG